MKKPDQPTRHCLISLILFLCMHLLNAQVMMFDDFNYSGANDPKLSSFNEWHIVNGLNGPPSNAIYDRNNVQFISDPGQAGNMLMTLKTTVNGNTRAVTHSRIQTAGFDYFEGTYAARVYFSDLPYSFGDANIETFFTIVSSALAGDGSRYSEIDFEYMPSDQWDGVPAVNDRTMYMTSWNRYQASPWMAWKEHLAITQSYAGWRDLIFSCTDGTNVKFWIDGNYVGSVDYAVQDGSTVYPRNPMQIAFANWIWNYALGSGTANRETEMKVDYVLFYKDTELSQAQVNNLVAANRSAGLIRQNLSGAKEYVEISSFSLQIEAEDYDNYGGIALENTTDQGGGQNVGWIDQGDWMFYGDHQIPTSGDYLLELRVASPNGSGLVNIHFNENGSTTDIGTYSIPNTGGWQNWTTISQVVNVGQGLRSFGIYAPSGGWNINWFRLTRISSSRKSLEMNDSESESTTVGIYPNPSKGIFNLNQDIKWVVISLSGQFIKQGKGKEINLLRESPGVYQVITSDGKFKIIKE